MADNVTTSDLELALEQLATSMGMSVVEYVESKGYSTVAELASATSNLQAQITAIVEMDGENGAVSLAEKVKAINDVLVNEEGVIQTIYTQIQENKQLVLDEVSRATGVEADLQSQITTNLNRNTTNETAISAINVAMTALTGRVTVNEEDIALLKGDETVIGSVANLIKVESDRAILKENETRSLTDLNTQAIADLSAGSSESVNGLDTRVKTIEDTLNDTTVDGNLVKGHKTRISDLELGAEVEATTRSSEVANALTDAKAYTDANTLKASSMDVCKIANKFRTSLGLADTTCGGEDGDGAVL